MAKKTKRTIRFDALPKDYDGLVRILVPRVIADEAELENTLEIVYAMAGQELSEDQGAYLLTLSVLVEEFETKTRPTRRKGTPLQILKYLLQENGMSCSDLGRLLGSRQLGSKILNRDRDLSKAHIRTLADRFKVRPGLFL